MIRREDIVAEALSWCGTPHLWQASRKGVGCDCKGLVAGVARELGMPEAESLYANMHSYNTLVDAYLLRRGLEETLRHTQDPQPGDVILMLMGNKPQHLGILISDRELVHTYGVGPSRVIRAALGKSRPIDSYWTWPSLGGA